MQNKSGNENSPDQRTEQNRIDTPADAFGVGLSSDFLREDAPLTETTERADHRFHRPQTSGQMSGADDSSVNPTNLDDDSKNRGPANTPRRIVREPQTDR